MPFRSLILSFVVILLTATTSSSVQAALITVWNFNDATNSVNSPANTAVLFSPDFGSGTMTSTFAATDITAFNGSTTNARNGDVAGQSLALQNQSNNGQSLTFGASTLNFNAIMVSFATQRTATGFNSNQFQYSLDGSTFVNFAAAYNPPTSFGLTTFDLSGIAGLNNNALATFRIIFNGNTSAAGNNRIDNLVIEGAPLVASVPEPGSILLMVLGGISLGIIGRRKHALA